MELDFVDTETVHVTAKNTLTQKALSSGLMHLIQEKNNIDTCQSTDPLSRIGGKLSVHCRADLENKKVLEVASMASLYKGYESLLPGKDLRDVGKVSSMASGICGGVHATASALCLEMALGLEPPALGIVLRNLLLSCQYLNDNSMHLFVLAGPDYSQEIIEKTNPEIWHRAKIASSQYSSIHGFSCISNIMLALNKGEGSLYKEAMKMASLAREAYTLLGGKYPHSESIIPGGVSVNADLEKLRKFTDILQPFSIYSHKTAAIWDDIFDFMLAANPRYEDLGKSPASLLDFGQWDHPDFYDGQYKHCDDWGKKRWSTPAAIIDGKLACSKLSELNAGMEEFFDFSFQTRAPIPTEDLVKQDPLGNPISAHHPWNKKMQSAKAQNPQAYSWGSSLTWRGHGFEVGAYSRLYLTALAKAIPGSRYLSATGSSLHFAIPSNLTEIQMQWRIPSVWNTFERNRARAYALAFNLSVTLENIAMARELVRSGNTQTHVPLKKENHQEQRLGVGLWGASRGFLAHWAVIKNQVIDNYQIAIPSRVNVGTRSPLPELAPLEKALVDTPIIESRFKNATDFHGIDIQRVIQSFDPCMSCSSHVLIQDSHAVVNREIDTRFPF